VIVQRDPQHPDVLALLDELAETYRQEHGSADLSDVPPSTWAAALVALDGGKPVGLVGLCALSQATVHLIRLYVRPAARRQGWARLLGDAALDLSGSLGFQEAVWDTGLDNPPCCAWGRGLAAKASKPSARSVRIRVSSASGYVSRLGALVMARFSEVTPNDGAVGNTQHHVVTSGGWIRGGSHRLLRGPSGSRTLGRAGQDGLSLGCDRAGCAERLACSGEAVVLRGLDGAADRRVAPPA
jgi:GNAT superfamily N-acetyltransferase